MTFNVLFFFLSKKLFAGQTNHWLAPWWTQSNHMPTNPKSQSIVFFFVNRNYSSVVVCVHKCLYYFSIFTGNIIISLSMRGFRIFKKFRDFGMRMSQLISIPNSASVLLNTRWFAIVFVVQHVLSKSGFASTHYSAPTPFQAWFYTNISCSFISGYICRGRGGGHGEFAV